jgi:hypothetical protein
MKNEQVIGLTFSLFVVHFSFFISALRSHPSSSAASFSVGIRIVRVVSDTSRPFSR